MTHGLNPATKDFSAYLECHPSSSFNLFDMQTKPEMRCNGEDGGEDVDMEYLMEMPLGSECENGNELVCLNLHAPNK